MAALSTIVDPADNLLFDFHQYFDDLGGSYGTCSPWTTFAVDFQQVTNFLRGSGRRGIMTEFGGAPGSDCKAMYPQLLDFFAANNDVWVGWTSWGSKGGLELSLDPKSPYYALTAILAEYAPGS